jgi:hypothetical protein
MASIRDTLANLVEQYKAGDTPMANLMRGDTEGAKQSAANAFEGMTKDPYAGLNVLGTTKIVGKLATSPQSLAKGLLENTPKVNDELQQPFIGYLNKDGSHEMYNHEAAKSADYHHSHLMENPDNYSNDDALTFVRMGGENIFTIKGNSVLDPYEKQSSKQIGTLAKKLIDQGADPLAPFHVEDLALPKIEAPYQGKQIGSLQDWVKYSK